MKHICLFLFLFALPSFALPETEVKASLDTQLIPFLASGNQFRFETNDGLQLSAIHFEHPSHRATIVVVTGQSESWLKFAEVFFDLYQRGYSIFAYDHRGQGQSPHLSTVNPQIQHVEFFSDYAQDLNTFVETVVKPSSTSESLYLLAHSMGGAVAMDYLSTYETPFQRAVLSAPMLQINTKPYPEAVGLALVRLQLLLRKGMNYAPTQGNYNFEQAFESNRLTRSEARFWLTNEMFRRYPQTLIGGTSNNWVYQSIRATHRIRNASGTIKVPFLLLQAEHDQMVKSKGQTIACANASSLCTFEIMADSEHEILMERDFIRNRALARIEAYFQ